MTAFEKVVPIDIGVRTRAIEATNRSVALEAGAGAGKTSVLVDRVLAVLESGTVPGRIAVITFTEKAAGEIAERVRDRIEVRLADAKGMARHVLERAVANLPDMATSTIHGFARTLNAKGLPVIVHARDAADFDAHVAAVREAQAQAEAQAEAEAEAAELAEAEAAVQSGVDEEAGEEAAAEEAAHDERESEEAADEADEEAAAEEEAVGEGEEDDDGEEAGEP